MKFKILATLIVSSLTFASVSDAEFNALKDRVEEIEFNNLIKNYTINGNLETNYNSYVLESDTNEDQVVRLYGLRSSLDLAFHVNDRIDFYTSFGMSKFWQVDARAEGTKTDIDGDGQRDLEPWEISQASGFAYEGANVKVDRAYFNYKISKNWLASIGRLPLYDGPMQHQLDGKPRSGTVARSARNSVYDGIVLTYDLGQFIPQEDSLKVKGFYFPWQNVNKYNRDQQLKTPGSTTNKPGGNAKVASNTLGSGLLVEYYNRELSWADSFEFHAFSTYYKDFWWNEFKQIYDGFTYTAIFGVNKIAHTGLNFSLIINGTRWNTADDENTKIKGEGFLYNLNYKFENTAVVGVEYLKTNKNHYADDFAYTDIDSFYGAKKANGFHAWTSLPIYDNLRARLGLYKYDKNATADDEVTSFYTKLLLNF
ncbi:DUF3373 family protein [Bacteriovorax sp. DB6_IX]|uniref:DUF3373 family protein n=1 Tax=Bacteriovorax sp. DB6_IX TaxID=1353530 RepID=UPI00038A1CA9|nr:DUF3373 family protein [Bacteriovorax sp. DB6_IX]EQC44447.1 PF11853 domain protein [Bacteriovorax sp. DB6_IX]